MPSEWEWLSIAADGATVITGIAVLCAILQFFEARKQRCRDADQWYVERYWELQDKKSIRRRLDGSVVISVPLQTLHQELRLCEDELDARASGWVSNSSWKIWAPSILATRDSASSMALLRRLPKDELCRLRAFLVDEADPQTIWPPKQLWRGVR